VVLQFDAGNDRVVVHIRKPTGGRTDFDFSVIFPAPDNRTGDVMGDRPGPAAISIPEDIRLLKQGHRPDDYALDFDGENSRIEVPDFRYLGDHPITIELILTPEAAGGGILADQRAAGSGYVLLTHQRPQSWQFAIWTRGQDQAPGGIELVRADRVVTGRRTHVAAVYDLREIRLYINGQLNGASTSIESPFLPSDSPLVIGENSHKGRIGSGRFRGRIEQVRISDAARYTGDFSPGEIMTGDPATLLLFQINEGEGTRVYDSSGRDHHGTIRGARWVRLR